MSTSEQSQDRYHDELLDTYRATPTTLRALLRQVEADEASARVGGSDEQVWSVVEIVCHLRDAEGHTLERVRAMRDEDHPILAAWDQEVLAEESGYRDQSLADAFAEFERLRAEQTALLADLSAEQWQRPGLHEEDGPMTIESLTAHMAAHDAIHLAQISRRILNQRSSSAGASD